MISTEQFKNQKGFNFIISMQWEVLQTSMAWTIWYPLVVHAYILLTLLCRLNITLGYDLTPIWALSLLKAVPLRSRRAQSPKTLYSNSALLVLKGASLNIDDSTLLAFNWQFEEVFRRDFLVNIHHYNFSPCVDAFTGWMRYTVAMVTEARYPLMYIVIHSLLSSLSLYSVVGWEPEGR